jgi:hypothetical protein
LESIVSGPNDEWPIHPSDEWPIRPDPKPGDAREMDHASGQVRPLLPRIKRSAVFTGILTLVFGIVFITDFFDGHEPELVGLYAFILLMGILDIFTDDDHDSRAYKKALREAKPRRVLISDDEQPIISIAKPIDGRISDDDVWPVLPQKDPEPSTPKADRACSRSLGPLARTTGRPAAPSTGG